MSWNNDVVLEFIELYRREQLLWDPKHSSHRNRSEIVDAWLRIQSELSTSYSILELKRKKESLMTSFRMHLSKKKIQEGYRTTWFAFTALESFLGGKYECDSTQLENESLTGSTSTTKPEYSGRKRNTTEWNSSPHRQLKNHSNDESDYTFVKKQHAETVRPFNVVERLADECELYAVLLAKKLRKLDERQRDIAMHEIDNIMFRAKMQTSSQGKSFASSPSSPDTRKTQSPIFIMAHQNSLQYEDENLTYQDQLQDPS